MSENEFGLKETLPAPAEEKAALKERKRIASLKNLGLYKAGSRRRQVLAALNENGPLSISLIQRIVRPKMSRRSAELIVKRFKAKGILTVHFESSHFRFGHFYRFSHKPPHGEMIAKWLQVSAQELSSTQFFSRELNQPVMCAEWSALLRDTFPNGKLWRNKREIRDHFFKVPENFLGKDHEMVPDIVLGLPPDEHGSTVQAGT